MQESNNPFPLLVLILRIWCTPSSSFPTSSSYSSGRHPIFRPTLPLLFQPLLLFPWKEKIDIFRGKASPSIFECARAQIKGKSLLREGSQARRERFFLLSRRLRGCSRLGRKRESLWEALSSGEKWSSGKKKSLANWLLKREMMLFDLSPLPFSPSKSKLRSVELACIFYTLILLFSLSLLEGISLTNACHVYFSACTREKGLMFFPHPREKRSRESY